MKREERVLGLEPEESVTVSETEQGVMLGIHLDRAMIAIQLDSDQAREVANYLVAEAQCWEEEEYGG